MVSNGDLNSTIHPLGTLRLIYLIILFALLSKPPPRFFSNVRKKVLCFERANDYYVTNCASGAGAALLGGGNTTI